MWTWSAANLVMLYHEWLVRQSLNREHKGLCLGQCGFGSTMSAEEQGYMEEQGRLGSGLLMGFPAER